MIQIGDCPNLRVSGYGVTRFGNKVRNVLDMRTLIRSNKKVRRSHPHEPLIFVQIQAVEKFDRGQ